MGGMDGYGPLLFEGKEGVGIVGVELEGLSDIRPSHGARRQGQLPGRGAPGGESSGEESIDEVEEEEAQDKGRHEEKHGGDGC